MAKGRRRSGTRGRGRRSAASYAAPRSSYARPTPALNDFDDDWLMRLRERPSARFVDLDLYEDRRRWSPSAVRGPRNFFDDMPRTIRGNHPRIVVVPEGHKLARHQTYKGKYALRQILNWDKHSAHTRWSSWTRSAWENYNEYHYGRNVQYKDQWHKVGFSMPWQVIICVRRKRRREVMHALRKTGRGAGKQKTPVRNEFSDVRC